MCTSLTSEWTLTPKLVCTSHHNIKVWMSHHIWCGYCDKCFTLNLVWTTHPIVYSEWWQWTTGKCGSDIAVMNRHGGGKAAQSDILLKPILQSIALAQICHSLKWKWRHKEQVTHMSNSWTGYKSQPRRKLFSSHITGLPCLVSFLETCGWWQPRPTWAEPAVLTTGCCLQTMRDAVGRWELSYLRVLDQNSSQTEPLPLLAGLVESGHFRSILQQLFLWRHWPIQQVCTEHDYTILCNADDPPASSDVALNAPGPLWTALSMATGWPLACSLWMLCSATSEAVAKRCRASANGVVAPTTAGVCFIRCFQSSTVVCLSLNLRRRSRRSCCSVSTPACLMTWSKTMALSKRW